MARDARKLKERVAKYLARQDYDGALKACLELRELAPRDDRTLLKLGELYQRLGRKDEALRAYRELVDFYADDGRLVRAISVSKLILDVDPEDDAAQKKLALLYSARGLPPAAAASTVRRDVAHGREHRPGSTGAERRDAPAAPTPAASRPPQPAPAASRPPQPAPAALRPQPAAQPPRRLVELDIDVDLAPPAATLDQLAAAEDPFRRDAEEDRRRQLGAEELADLDLGELDLAFVEVAPEAAKYMPHTPLFSDLAPEELDAVLRGLQARRIAPGEAIVRQGEVGDAIYVVSDGQVRVRVRRADGEETEVATLGEGAFFGEFGLFTNGLRHATVVADGEVEVLEIRHADLLAVARAHPRVREVLQSFYRERALDTALAASKLFGHLGAAARRELAAMAAVERHQPGSMVLQEGDDGVGLYLVRSGQLEVRSEDLSGTKVVLAQLSTGDFFGEISVLTHSPITADVVAVAATDLIKFSPREIVAICAVHPEVRRALDRTREFRLHQTIERLSEAGVV